MEVLRENRKFGVKLVRSVGPEERLSYSVFDGNETVFTSSVEAAALVEYEDLLEARRAPTREARARDMAQAQARALHAETVSRTYKRTTAKGGKGGRGGV